MNPRIFINLFLSPFIWSFEYITIIFNYLIREQTFSKVCFTYYERSMCNMFKASRYSWWRESDYNFFIWIDFSDCLNWRGKITIARNNESCIKFIFICINKKLSSYAYICHFLFIRNPDMATIITCNSFKKVVSKKDFRSIEGIKRLKVG